MFLRRKKVFRGRKVRKNGRISCTMHVIENAGCMVGGIFEFLA